MANSGDLSRRPLPAKGNTGVLISQHYLEIEYLLDLVESSTSHYQTLGLDRSASDEQIVRAYHEAIGVLHPSYHKVRAAQTDEMLARIDNAFKRISQAFIVLTNTRSRTEYDQSFNRRSAALPPVETPKTRRAETSTARPARKSEPTKPVERSAGNTESNSTASDNGKSNGSKSKSIPVRMSRASMSDAVSVTESTTSSAFSKLSVDAATVNRRRIERYTISLPALVAGCDRESGKWQEMTKSFDLSRIGIGIRLKKRVWPGMVLHLTMPMPTRLRTHGYSDPAYKAYAIVRRVEPIKDGMRIVGLEFLGERPPSFYLHKPWATFRTQEWSGANRRREPRENISTGVRIEYLNEAMEIIRHEAATTENISLSGARVHVKNPPADFEWIRVTSQRRHFESLALVRNRYPGRDGDERLCLQFTENKWPMI